MIGAPSQSRWRPTGALARAALAVPVLGLGGVLLERPALIVLAAPLAVAFLVSVMRRPTAVPVVTSGPRDRVVAEGEASKVTTVVSGEGIEQMTRLVVSAPFSATAPGVGVVSASSDGVGAPVMVVASVRQRRWGSREVGAGLVSVTSPWGGYRWGPVTVPGQPVRTLPAPLPFDSRAETPRPSGVVGPNRASRDGEGAEFSGIREFQVGDRLRRIHWRSSLRTGRLHTVTTLAELDSEVLLVVDALADLGRSGGIDGAPSSLDTEVRAAAALAEHHLRIGNRVGLRVVGGPSQVLRPASGARHQRRILETLAGVAAAPWDHAPDRMRLGTGAGTTVIMLSPLLSPLVVTTLVDLAGRGLPVVAVDCMPDRPAHRAVGNEITTQAWRLRLVERRLELVALVRAGVPVIPWRGPGTLDEVMRRLARRSQLPRAVAR